ncbi:MAG: efflux RND transporter periplasmic adaptor subunit, partial [Chloroflexota bacterium]
PAAEAQVRLAKNQEYLTQQNVEELSARTNEGTSHSPQTPLFSKGIGQAQSGVAWEQTQLAEANLAQLLAGPTPEQVAQAEAAVEAAQGQLALAKQPTTDYDVAAARAAVAQAQAAVDLAQVQLTEATVRAPFAGIVTQRLVSEGAMAGPATPLLNIISNDMEVVVNVDEAAAMGLKAGDQASLTASAFPGRAFQTTVGTISPAVDARTHTVQVRLTPTGDQGALRDGMFVQVQFAGNATTRETLTVPSAALLQEDGAVVVYVVDGGKAHRRTVVTGLADGDRVEVVSGLAAGEQVIVSGLSGLTEGQEVTVQ